ncbi:hypothetical protein CCR82_03845 [Halochromatium salexigens]|uniref:Uncharacterized protein n=1 Tax=Halochromatium salexigens TaxID=49447 RepID=A0AAJ0XEW6_HALSE|nr:hypothetical protein [Halochromatium salexigens]
MPAWAAQVANRALELSRKLQAGTDIVRPQLREIFDDLISMGASQLLHLLLIRRLVHAFAACKDRGEPAQSAQKTSTTP